MKTIKLSNGRKIGHGEPCFIVAEIGQNHQGDVYTATRLIKMAHEAGVDAVKLCKRDIDSDLTRAAQMEPYTGPNSFGPTYGAHRRALELSADDYRHLKERMRYNEWPEILFSTVCDRKSADEVEEAINPPLYKIASRDLDNLPLLDHVARFGKPMILSTGMAAQGREIADALETVAKHHEDIILLYCLSEYPMPIEHVSWQRMLSLNKWEYPVGFSDHTAGIVAAQTLGALGACAIERHITLARAMKGTDHAASLEAEGLARLVRNVRLGELIRRQRIIDSTTDTERNRAKLGRSLVTTRTIHAGETITESDVCLKSPGTGIRWADRAKVIGKQARTRIQEDTTLALSDVMEPVEATYYPGG